MTYEELEAICTGIAPVIKEFVSAASQRHDLELATLREAVLPQLRAAETRSVELETRCARLETKLLELEAQAAAVRS